MSLLCYCLCFCQVAVTRIEGAWFHARWLGRCATSLACILSLSLLLHWLAFRTENLLLPMGRTGIFLVPLTTLLAGVIAAAPGQSRAARWLRRGITAVLFCLALYFLFCLRLSYFKEYKFDADAEKVYSVLARYNHAHGITDIGMTGLSLSALNYYRVLSKRETFPEFKVEPPDPPLGKSVYVLDGANERKFIGDQKLIIVYKGDFSDLVIAVKPGAAGDIQMHP